MQNVPFFVIARFDLSNRSNLLNFRLLRFSIENLAMTKWGEFLDCFGESTICSRNDGLFFVQDLRESTANLAPLFYPQTILADCLLVECCEMPNY